MRTQQTTPILSKGGTKLPKQAQKAIKAIMPKAGKKK